MRLAQQLYEGVEVKGKGTIALISYLRTDSTRISEEADAAARSFIQEQYGTKYTASGDTTENKNSKAQDAHEAIRPTDVTNTPVMVKESLPKRSVPPVSADLETLCGKPHAASRL